MWDGVCPVTLHSRALCPHVAVPWIPVHQSPVFPNGSALCPCSYFSAKGWEGLPQPGRDSPPGGQGPGSPKSSSRQGHCAVVSSFGTEPVNRAMPTLNSASCWHYQEPACGMAELSFWLLLASVRAQELPRESKKKAKCLGQSCSLRGSGVCFRQFQHLLLPQNLHQHWLCMTFIEGIPPACGPWGAKCQGCPVPGVAAMGHEALVGLPFPEVADGRMC